MKENEENPQDICDKCGKKAYYFYASSLHKTLKLCKKCNDEYEEYIRQKANEFLGKEFFKKGEK